jgi:hypothetical protein
MLLGWYVTVEKRGRTTLYGPCATENEAMLANYFYKSVTERDQAGRGGNLMHLFRSGTQGFEPEELAQVMRNPIEWGYQVLRVRPVTELPIHPSWGTLSKDPTFSADLRSRDWDAFQHSRGSPHSRR